MAAPSRDTQAKLCARCFVVMNTEFVLRHRDLADATDDRIRPNLSHQFSKRGERQPWPALRALPEYLATRPFTRSRDWPGPASLTNCLTPWQCQSDAASESLRGKWHPQVCGSVCSIKAPSPSVGWSLLGQARIKLAKSSRLYSCCEP